MRASRRFALVWLGTTRHTSVNRALLTDSAMPRLNLTLAQASAVCGVMPRRYRLGTFATRRRHRDKLGQALWPAGIKPSQIAPATRPVLRSSPAVRPPGSHAPQSRRPGARALRASGDVTAGVHAPAGHASGGHSEAVARGHRERTLRGCQSQQSDVWFGLQPHVDLPPLHDSSPSWLTAGRRGP